MGPGSGKIDLSPFESWDPVQNDQHKLQSTLDIAVPVQTCVGLVKHAHVVFWQISTFLENSVGIVNGPLINGL